MKTFLCSDGDMAVGHARAPYIFMYLFIQAVWPSPTPTASFPFATYQPQPSDTHTHTMISAGKEEKQKQMHFRKKYRKPTLKWPLLGISILPVVSASAPSACNECGLITLIQ